MAGSKGFAEEQQAFGHTPDALRSVDLVRLRIDSAGRIVIPAEMRASMMVKPGDTVTAEVVEGELRIMSSGVTLRRVQEIARELKARNPGDSLVDELIAERRDEALREDQRYERLARESAEDQLHKGRTK